MLSLILGNCIIFDSCNIFISNGALKIVRVCIIPWRDNTTHLQQIIIPWTYPFESTDFIQPVIRSSVVIYHSQYNYLNNLLGKQRQISTLVKYNYLISIKNIFINNWLSIKNFNFGIFEYGICDILKKRKEQWNRIFFKLFWRK